MLYARCPLPTQGGLAATVVLASGTATATATVTATVAATVAITAIGAVDATGGGCPHFGGRGGEQLGEGKGRHKGNGAAPPQCSRMFPLLGCALRLPLGPPRALWGQEDQQPPMEWAHWRLTAGRPVVVARVEVAMAPHGASRRDGQLCRSLVVAEQWRPTGALDEAESTVGAGWGGGRGGRWWGAALLFAVVVVVPPSWT